MSYRPYRCGIDCRGGYNCLICLIVFNIKKIGKKIKKIRKGVFEKTSSAVNNPVDKKDS